MTAADRAQAMRRRLKPSEAPTDPELAAPERSAPAAPMKDVRQTVDLPHPRHLAFAAWRMETAVQLGRSRLTTQDALAALIETVLTDEVVARRVRAFIEGAGGA